MHVANNAKVVDLIPELAIHLEIQKVFYYEKFSAEGPYNLLYCH